MKPLFRFSAAVLAAAAVLVSTPGCERRSAAVTKMFVDEAMEKTNTHGKGHGDSHGKKKDGAHPSAAPAASPQKFIAPPGK